MPIAPETARARSVLGGYRRHGRPADDPDVVQAERALALANTEVTIRRAIENAPPLDADTLARIRALIPAVPTERGGRGGA